MLADEQTVPCGVDAALEVLEHLRWVETTSLVAACGQTSGHVARPLNVYELRCADLAIQLLETYFRVLKSATAVELLKLGLQEESDDAGDADGARGGTEPGGA